MGSDAPWESFLREHFPGYLLPNSLRVGIPREEAERFLERLTGKPRQLRLLLSAALLAAHLEELRALAVEQLPALVRTLTARTEVHSRVWEGGYQGRLDVRATLQRRLQGEPTSFVTRARRRRFDLPEQLLVRATVRRLLGVLGELREAGVLAHYGWSAAARDGEGRLRHLLEGSVLREVPDARPDAFHLRAAELARHPCYGLARRWHLGLEQLEEREPERLARLLAEGALVPLEAHTRFELAVALRLLQALEEGLALRQPGRWSLHRTLVLPRGEELATFSREDGARLRLFYNRSFLESGAVEEGTRHYLGALGRMRPDLTLVTEVPGRERRAALVEIKHSSNPETLLAGYHEALVYRTEYAPWLTGWPRALLVSSGRTQGAPRPGDDVVAVDWARWVPAEILDGLLHGL